MRVEIILAGPPRGKGRPRASVAKGGFVRMHTDEKTVKYETQLRYAAQQAMAGRAPTDLPVRISMTIAFAVPESWSKRKKEQALAGVIWPCVKPDCDNSLKLVDALNGIVWVDDKQVVVALVRKVYSTRPGLTIDIDTLNAQQQLAA
jgi:Holliday junction resolvase RusA-like endonuclease